MNRRDMLKTGAALALPIKPKSRPKYILSRYTLTRYAIGLVYRPNYVPKNKVKYIDGVRLVRYLGHRSEGVCGTPDGSWEDRNCIRTEDDLKYGDWMNLWSDHPVYAYDGQRWHRSEKIAMDWPEFYEGLIPSVWSLDVEEA